MKARRTLERGIVLSAVVALLVGVTALPAGAQQGESPEEIKNRLEQEIANSLGQVQDVVEGLEGQANEAAGNALRALANGDVGGAVGAVDDFATDATCETIEAHARHAPYAYGSAISYDLDAGMAYADFTVPSAPNGTSCVFASPIPVQYVSWGLYPVAGSNRTWGWAPQWKAAQDSLNITGSGTYHLEVPLPRPTTSIEALEAANDVVYGSADGVLGALEEGEDGLLDGIIGDLIASLTPEQLDAIIDLVCSFQVDVFRADAADVPDVLGGPIGTVGLTDPDVPVTSLIDGDVVYTHETLDSSADLGGLDLGGLDLAALCVPDPPPEVGGEDITNAGVDTGGNGVDVGGATEALPRTGSNAPGVAGTGLALIVAGWLVLTGNAVGRARRRRLNRV